ncbi:MAG: hypothetical protein ABRQ24_04625 [Syntrophomonadaceae bacterium]
MFFKVVVACGHLGFRREVEVTRYFQADNALAAWDSAMNMPRAKKGQGSRCVRMVEEIGLLEYLHGRAGEAEDPYLQTHRPRRKVGVAC